MTKTLIVNLQRKLAVDLSIYKNFCEQLPNSIHDASRKHFSVAFVSDRRMKELNGLFRNTNTTTDVLSFPHEPDEFDPDRSNLGDIVISIEQAVRQANENHLTLENEIKQLILHGVLHLCGYDHETDNGEMNARELELRDKLGI
jgi:probable rRNA maturation factor